MANTIVWASIPAIDLERARRFYSAVLEAEATSLPGMEGVVVLPGDEDSVSADITASENNKPSAQGVTIYLDSKGDPEGMMERAVAAGGKVLAPVADMGKMVGSIGFFLDSEGNRIGVHKPPEMD
jgi:predicted enzyme related to lactoylglutathione lyase